MNKKLLVAAVMAAMTLSTASVFAAAPTFSGDAQLLTQKSDGGDTYTDVRFRLNADAQLGDGLYAHGRLMGIDESPNNYGTAGTGSKGAAMNMEQLFLGGKVGSVDFKIGRQPLFVGQGMLADVNGIEGLSLATSVDNVTVNGFVGRSNENVYPNTTPPPTKTFGSRDTVAFNIGTKLDGVNLGAGFMNTKDTTENKYWSVNANGNITDKVNLAGVYVKNDTLNKDGFIATATVGSIAKKGDFNYAVSYRNIENGAVDGDWVTNGAFADSKGFRLAANYKVTDNSTLIAYQDITKQNSDETKKPNQFRVEYDVNF